jgi:hypothetical protein
VVPLAINLKNKKIDTAYDTKWPDREQNLQELTKRGKDSEFQLDAAQMTDKVLKLSLRK